MENETERKYISAKEIEMQNYMETICRLSEKSPYLIEKLIEIAKENEKKDRLR